MLDKAYFGASRWEFTNMSDAGSISARFCTNCGTQLQGKFCGACGSAADVSSHPQQPSEGWGSLTSDFLRTNNRNGILAVALSFLRRPVDTIIRLTDDSIYRGQWGFLTAMVGAQMTLAYVVLPRLYAAFLNVPNTSNSSAVISNEIVQYVGMAILTPIQYYVCRLLGTRQRSPMSYVKLCVLSVSYCSLLSLIVLVFFAAATIADLKTASVLDLGEFWQTLQGLLTIAILVFVTASHRRFWGMSWLIATGLTLAIAAMSWFVVYPGLTALMEHGGVAGAISRITGG
jgi:hypothetical protein